MPENAEPKAVPLVSEQTKTQFFYEVYGLTVDSELELPELTPVNYLKKDQADVQIRFGEAPDTLNNLIGRWSWCMASRTEFVFIAEGAGRYHIADGRKITIEPPPDPLNSVPAADIRLWLLGSAFGALLHQRGLIPLHVSAVKASSGVWAFTGESGEGKSTLAGFLHLKFAWELMSDDVSVINPDHKEPVIYPGPRKLKLCADALDHLEFHDCKSVQDLSNTDKFQLYLSGDDRCHPEPLHALVVLESATGCSTSSIEFLTGKEAFNACLDAVYRPFMQSWFKLPEHQMMELVRFCKSIKVYRFRRPRSLEQMDAHLQPLLSLMAGDQQ